MRSEEVSIINIYEGKEKELYYFFSVFLGDLSSQEVKKEKNYDQVLKIIGYRIVSTNLRLILSNHFHSHFHCNSTQRKHR